MAYIRLIRIILILVSFSNMRETKDTQGLSQYQGGRGAHRKFSWQTLEDTCKFFVNYILTPKRYQKFKFLKNYMFWVNF